LLRSTILYTILLSYLGFQVRLNGVATLVGRLGVYVALMVFVVLMGAPGAVCSLHCVQLAHHPPQGEYYSREGKK